MISTDNIIHKVIHISWKIISEIVNLLVIHFSTGTTIYYKLLNKYIIIQSSYKMWIKNSVYECSIFVFF
jgi:hypothetical protein